MTFWHLNLSLFCTLYQCRYLLLYSPAISGGFLSGLFYFLFLTDNILLSRASRTQDFKRPFFIALFVGLARRTKWERDYVLVVYCLCILPLVRSLNFTRGLQPAICSLRFTLNWFIILQDFPLSHSSITFEAIALVVRNTDFFVTTGKRISRSQKHSALDIYKNLFFVMKLSLRFSQCCFVSVLRYIVCRFWQG